jgi:hypothetical protein
MTDDDKLTEQLNVRMSAADMALLEELQKALQERAPRGVKVTQRMVILEALDALQTRERDRKRKR